MSNDIRRNQAQVDIAPYLNEKKYTIHFRNLDVCCTEEQILSIMKSLKTSAANDIYNMSNNLIKTHMHELKAPLNKIFNELLDKGEFPDALKRAIVKPLHKEGDRTV